jgi:hypothetical protein
MSRAFFPTLFCGATSDPLELRDLRRLATPVYFRAGKTIFSEGERADSVLPSLRALYVFTNCCQMDGVRFWHLRSRAISSECRSLSGIAFRPTQSAKLPCAGFHATSLQIHSIQP